MSPQLEIRPAVAADAGLILDLICELAEYEKLGHCLAGSEELLQRWLFGPRPVAECLVAEWGGEAAGFALFFHNFSTFLTRPGIYLEDLFVRPWARGKGIGKALLARLARLAVERGCGRLEWSVLDWNESAIGFYRSLGAQPVEGWTVFRVAGEALPRLAEANSK